MQKNYSCCFIYLNNKLLSEATKENTKNLIDELINKCNVKDFYFSNLNILDNFAYTLISKKKSENINIKRIKYKNYNESTNEITNNTCNENFKLSRYKIKNLNIYKKIIFMCDFCILVDQEINLCNFYNNDLCSLMLYIKYLKKQILFV